MLLISMRSGHLNLVYCDCIMLLAQALQRLRCFYFTAAFYFTLNYSHRIPLLQKILLQFVFHCNNHSTTNTTSNYIYASFWLLYLAYSFLFRLGKSKGPRSKIFPQIPLTLAMIGSEAFSKSTCLCWRDIPACGRMDSGPVVAMAQIKNYRCLFGTPHLNEAQHDQGHVSQGTEPFL